jgi:hypothetical protein
MSGLDLSAAAVLDIAERIAAVAVFLTAIELLLVRSELHDGGVLDWHLLSRRSPGSWLDRFVRTSAVSRVLDYPGVIALALIDLAAAAVMVIEPRLIAGPLICLVIHIGLSKRSYPSVDGSDDMLVLILGVAVLRTLAPDPDVQLAAVLFLAGQSALSYLTSGLSKSQSRSWWNGSGLHGILTTRSYGEPHVARLVAGYPAITRALGPLTIVWECAFPLAILAGPGPTLVLVAIAASFHLACGFVMGLTAFTWAFGAALPAVVYTSYWLANHVGTPERLLLAAVFALPVVGAACFFGGAASMAPKVPAVRSVPARVPARRGEAREASAAPASTAHAAVEATAH